MIREQGAVIRYAWDVFIGLCATVSALIIPADLVLGLADAAHVIFIEWGLTAIYAVDFVVRYRQSRRSAPDLVRKVPGGPRYPIVGLVADVLAALPLFPLGLLQMALIRLIKLVRVADFMRHWRQREVRYTAVLRLAFFIYWLSLSAHWITCGWIALRDQGGDTWTRYLDALYWCVTTLTTVGYGDVTPANNAQTLYVIGVMIVGVGVYAYIIANIASILTNIDPARAHYLSHRELLAAFMQYRNLPRGLQQRIRDYYDYLWEQRHVFDETTILKDLPPQLSMEVSLFLKGDLIEKVVLFQGAGEAFIREVALQMRAVVVMPGDYVIRAGELGRDMYFISRGTLEVVSPNELTVYRTLSDGDFFGEIALFFDQPRSASVRAVTYCDLYRLDRAMFDRILADFPGVGGQIETLAKARFRQESGASKQ